MLSDIRSIVVKSVLLLTSHIKEKIILIQFSIKSVSRDELHGYNNTVRHYTTVHTTSFTDSNLIHLAETRQIQHVSSDQHANQVEKKYQIKCFSSMGY